MKKIAVACGILALVGFSSAPVRAGHGSFSVGVGIGIPGPVYYHRPCWDYYDYPYYTPYYRPYPVYVAPPPIIVQPAPVIQAAPVAPTAYQAAASPSADVEHWMQQLGDGDERVRADSVMQLGRLKAQVAIDPLAATLAGDRSPVVREAAARALGLIGSPQALPALQHAAQADSDSQVRHSAQFATEVVMSNRPQ